MELLKVSVLSALWFCFLTCSAAPSFTTTDVKGLLKVRSSSDAPMNGLASSDNWSASMSISKSSSPEELSMELPDAGSQGTRRRTSQTTAAQSSSPPRTRRIESLSAILGQTTSRLDTSASSMQPPSGSSSQILKMIQRYEPWWAWYRSRNEGPWPDLDQRAHQLSYDTRIARYFQYSSRVGDLDGIKARILRDPALQMRIDSKDILRLKQSFHPWSQVDINDLKTRMTWYESYMRAEKIFAEEVERILERAFSLH